MGKLKRAKKFRQTHLATKVDQRNKERKYANSAVGRSRARSTGAQRARPAKDAKNFSLPTQPLAILEEPGFEKHLSESDDESSDGGSDEDLLSREEQEYLDDTAENAEADETELTAATVAQWEKDGGSSPKVIKQIIRAFSSEELIAEPKVVDKLTALALIKVPEALGRILPLSAKKTPVQNKRLTEFNGALKMYCQTLVRLLKSGAKEERTKLTLTATQKTLPYYISMRKILKELAKALTGVVVNPDASTAVTMDAFSVIQDGCAQYPAALVELFLKTNYEAFVRVCGAANSYTLGTIDTAKVLFSLLYAFHPKLSYPVAFQQIRPLAMHLKASLDKTKNPDAAQNVVYTWQYVQSLDFFSKVISTAATHDPKSSLLQLIHPLVQVMLRTCTLIPSAAYFPLRFFIVRSLVRLAQSTGVYIPLAPILLEVLNSSALKKKGKKSSLQQFDFATNIRVPQNYLDTMVFQNSLADELVDLFAESFVLYSKSIAFPELAGPVIVALKRFMKHSSNGRLDKNLQQLVERLQTNSNFIMKERANVDFGPRDKEQVDAFLKNEDWEKTPLGSYVVVRRKVREERQRTLAGAQEGADDSDMADLDGLEDKDDAADETATSTGPEESDGE